MQIGYIQNLQLVLYMTQTLQPNELGSFILGTSTNLDFFSILVPPQLQSLSILGYCSHTQLAQVSSRIGQPGPKTEKIMIVIFLVCLRHFCRLVSKQYEHYCDWSRAAHPPHRLTDLHAHHSQW